MRNSESRRLLVGLLFLIFFVILYSPIVDAAESAKPVSIKSACDGKISSAVISSFREAIGNSPRYRLVATLADNGQMDVVLTIDANCTEKNNVAAVATVFGRAKCLAVNNCRWVIDGRTIEATLCDPAAAAECGRSLFKTFDDYASRTSISPPKVD